jgi:hypothetical protein
LSTLGTGLAFMYGRLSQRQGILEDNGLSNSVPYQVGGDDNGIVFRE